MFLGSASLAGAQDTLRLGTANPAKVFNDMQETKDLKEKMDAEGKNLINEGNAREEEIRGLQAAIKILSPGSPQYQEKQKELFKKAIDLDVWKKVNQAQLQQNQKLQMKLLFDKITEATKAVAQQEKLDLVIAETNVEFPDIDQMNVDQLRALINQRNVLFNSGKFDISEKITTKLNADYKAGQK